MEYRNLGRTGLKVSRLCLGTMNFGPRTSEPDSFAIMDKALELGINFFDTANVYGGQDAKGHHRADRRPLAGPGGRPAGEDRPGDEGLRPDGARPERSAACRRITSARRARTACAACRPTTSTSTRCTTSSATTPWDEIWQAMELLVQQGKILYVGSSNFAGWDIATANVIASQPALPGPGQRAEHLQPGQPHGRAGGAAGCQALRPGRDPLEPAGGRAARRGAARARRASRRVSDSMKKQIEKHRAQPGAVGETLRRAERRRRPTWRWRGCCTTRR